MGMNRYALVLVRTSQRRSSTLLILIPQANYISCMPIHGSLCTCCTCCCGLGLLMMTMRANGSIWLQIPWNVETNIPCLWSLDLSDLSYAHRMAGADPWLLAAFQTRIGVDRILVEDAWSPAVEDLSIRVAFARADAVGRELARRVFPTGISARDMSPRTTGGRGYRWNIPSMSRRTPGSMAHCGLPQGPGFGWVN
ncbi:hypothetical protein GE09DRAFT_697566 [Coniochaeta sp. 2T2.1]|nr:hypothetical protein GE09DRAFT_697566 [Coniochaeta sp. 2T2.1]